MHATEYGSRGRCLSGMERAAGNMPDLTSVESSASSLDWESN